MKLTSSFLSMAKIDGFKVCNTVCGVLKIILSPHWVKILRSPKQSYQDCSINWPYDRICILHDANRNRWKNESVDDRKEEQTTSERLYSPAQNTITKLHFNFLSYEFHYFDNWEWFEKYSLLYNYTNFCRNKWILVSVHFKVSINVQQLKIKNVKNWN